MPQYKLSPEKFTTIKKRLVARFVVMFAICLPIILLLGNQREKVSEGTNVFVTVCTFLFALAVFIFSLRRSLKYIGQSYTSYTLIIDGNSISRLQQNTPAISMLFNNIAAITKTAKGHIIINGKTPGDTITIPPTVERPKELEMLLQTIQPIAENKATPFMQKYNLLISVLIVAMMVCVYAVNNKIVVGICGALVSIVLVWGMVGIQANKNSSQTAKRNVLWALIVLISVMVVTIVKLGR